MKNRAEVAVKLLSFAWLALIVFLPASAIGSFVVTLLLSIVLFGAIERDKNRHEREFYFRGTPSESTLTWLKRIGNTEIAFRGLLLATTSIFLFQGTEELRVFTNRASFVICTVLTFIVIRHLDRRSGFDALRWGYVKMSLFAGVVISLPVGISDPISLMTTATELLKVTFSGSVPIDEAVEIANALAAHLNGAIRWVIQLAVGDLLGYLISAALSTNVVYGFLVVLYASALHSGIKWTRKRFDSTNENNPTSFFSGKREPE